MGIGASWQGVSLSAMGPSWFKSPDLNPVFACLRHAQVRDYARQRRADRRFKSGDLNQRKVGRLGASWGFMSTAFFD